MIVDLVSQFRLIRIRMSGEAENGGFGVFSAEQVAKQILNPPSPTFKHKTPNSKFYFFLVLTKPRHLTSSPPFFFPFSRPFIELISSSFFPIIARKDITRARLRTALSHGYIDSDVLILLSFLKAGLPWSGHDTRNSLFKSRFTD